MNSQQCKEIVLNTANSCSNVYLFCNMWSVLCMVIRDLLGLLSLDIVFLSIVSTVMGINENLNPHIQYACLGIQDFGSKASDSYCCDH